VQGLGYYYLRGWDLGIIGLLVWEGGFVLINLVINLIPIFYLLFLKLPVKFGRGLSGFRDISFEENGRGANKIP